VTILFSFAGKTSQSLFTDTILKQTQY